MESRTALGLLTSLLLLGCASTHPAVSSGSRTCPDKAGEAQSASVTCRAGYLPACSGCGSAAPGCHCVPIPK
jgi:hypothetical protein